MKLIEQEGEEFNSEKLLKWEFYSVADEEMMPHSNAENNIIKARQLDKHNYVHISFPRDKGNTNLIKAPT